jgi:hypothetical protein
MYLNQIDPTALYPTYPISGEMSALSAEHRRSRCPQVLDITNTRKS